MEDKMLKEWFELTKNVWSEENLYFFPFEIERDGCEMVVL